MALARKPIKIIKNSKNPLLFIHKSWSRVFIKDIAEILNGYAFKSSLFSNENGMPLIRIRDVNKNKTDTFYQGVYQDAYVVKNGDLLIGMDGDFNSVVWKGGEALLNQRVCKVSLISNNYDFDFMTYALQPYLNAIHAETSAVTVKHLSSRTIGEIPLPFPPLNQQKQIVAKIEELFSHIDAGIEGLKKSKALLKQYRQSVLKAAVTGELTKDWREANKDKIEPANQLLQRILKKRRQRWEEQQLKQLQVKGKPPTNDKWKEKYKEPVLEAKAFYSIPDEWCWTFLQNVFEVITDGDHQAPPKSETGVPFLVIGNVNTGKLNFENSRFVPESYFNSLSEIRQPKKGDILYTVVGSYGIPVLVDSDKPFCVQRHIGILKPEAEMIVQFLYYSLLSGYTYQQATDVATGTAQKTVPLGGLRLFKFALPSVEEQKEIVQRVEEKLTASDRLMAELDTKLTQAQQQKQTILASAFSGQLLEI